MKSCFTSYEYIIRELQIKTRYHHKPTRMFPMQTLTTPDAAEEQQGPQSLLVGMQNHPDTGEDTVEVS